MQFLAPLILSDMLLLLTGWYMAPRQWVMHSSVKECTRSVLVLHLQGGGRVWLPELVVHAPVR